MNVKLKEKIRESLSAVLPITGIVLLLSSVLIPLEIGVMAMFFAGAFMLIIGMGMFQLGVEMSMSPLGEGMGASLAKSCKLGLATVVSLAMGVLVTIAEPSLQILSRQVPAIPNMVLILTVAAGVGICLCIAVLRIVLHINLSLMLIFFYTILILFSFVPGDFLAVAFDSGGVTTFSITVPFIMALGVGLSAVRGDRNASGDSFGLVALSSVGPIMAVMVLGCCYAPEEALYTPAEVARVVTMKDVSHAFAVEIPKYAREVAVAVGPIWWYLLFFSCWPDAIRNGRSRECVWDLVIHTWD